MTLSVILCVTLQCVVSIKWWTRLILHGDVDNEILTVLLIGLDCIVATGELSDILREYHDFHHQGANQVLMLLCTVRIQELVFST